MQFALSADLFIAESDHHPTVLHDQLDADDTP
jgi:hypothetical protein